MPPAQQRRRRQAAQEESDEDVRQRSASPENSGSDGDERMGGIETDETSQWIKKLVRYALACDFARTPIRRDGIKEKVLGRHGREFKKVFAGAQKQLRATFGMEMVELPAKDRNLLTADQKRKAAKSQSQKEPTSNSYMLVSVLPTEFRTPTLPGPSRVASSEGEAAYTALYSTIIAIITLSGGELSDPRLRRHLQRLNATENMPSMNPNDNNAPNERADAVLQRMQKQGYLHKNVENKGLGDEDSTTWHVGPRGKVEVNHEAVAAIVRKVFDAGEGNEELEKKLQVSLEIQEGKAALAGVAEEEEAERQEANGQPGPSTRRRRRTRADAEEDDEE
ncbi:MAGE family-domain-containing protein [Lasiosphaeria hispida]|uniref:MAGE family-domain-containing protein n=1 Tax=Lasiosphaeria hispida TaxID=260671 RepID=A0AAJ0HVH0_9PEZI|nr:MAGE family-domain-containing protein [Lasiosphaeria hispida]